MKSHAQLKSELLRELVDSTRRRTGDRAIYRHLAKYDNNPREFALKILGSRWWSAQTEIGQALTRFDRVIVRSGNGIGKTHVAADLALWFLYTQRPAVVITTATTMDQVKKPLWQEIHARVQGASVKLPGKLLETSLRLDDGSYAIGVATRKAGRGVSFQGHHSPNLLVIIDEASGVHDEIWEAAAGIAVGRNNKILALGDPLRCSGRFYELFKGARGWHKITLNALHHPNVTGKGTAIPGSVHPAWIDQQIAEWCEEIPADGVMRCVGDEVIDPVAPFDHGTTCASDESMDAVSPHHLITSSPHHLITSPGAKRPTAQPTPSASACSANSRGPTKSRSSRSPGSKPPSSASSRQKDQSASPWTWPGSAMTTPSSACARDPSYSKSGPSKA